MSKRRVRVAGFLIFLLGLLFSPLKQYTLRCWSNPWGWLEAECQQFKEFHSPWGYAIMGGGIALILFSIFHRYAAKESE